MPRPSPTGRQFEFATLLPTVSSKQVSPEVTERSLRLTASCAAETSSPVGVIAAVLPAPEDRLKSHLVAERDRAPPNSFTASACEEQNSASTALPGSSELSLWRGSVGLPAIRRAVAASFLSPAASACRSALSAAFAILPYVWSSKPVAFPRDVSEYCVTTQLPPLPSFGSNCEECDSKNENCEAASSSETAASHSAPPEFVRCPQCSGVFRWQDAQHLPESGGGGLSKQGSVSPLSHTAQLSKKMAIESTSNCSRNLSSKCSPKKAHPRRSLEKPPPLLESPCKNSAHRAEAVDCSSDCGSARVVKHRHPRWIRFLVKRLMCFHTSGGRRVRESRQSCQGQKSSGGHRHLSLRHRKRTAKDLSTSREWPARSEEGMPAAASGLVGPKQDCQQVASADKAGRPVELEVSCPISRMGSARTYPRTATAQSISPSHPGCDEAPVASPGTASDNPVFSSCSSLGAADVGTSGSGGDGKREHVQTSDASSVNPEQQTGKATACSDVVDHALQVDLWPMISPEALEADDSSWRTAFDKLEKQRLRFNTLHRQQGMPSTATLAWNRLEEMQQLSDLLISASIRSMLRLDCTMPCVHCHDGLQVWKGESVGGNFTCRATFLVPVEPRLYATFASDSELRCQWDKHVTEQHVIEQVDAGRDICYVAFRRIATVYPRDLVTLRVKCRLPVRPKAVELAEASTGTEHSGAVASPDWQAEPESEAEMIAYSSMSCSIDHQDAPEAGGRVRMDVRVNAYLAKPVRTPFGLWSEVTLVNESDPGGWIPAAVTRTMCLKRCRRIVDHYESLAWCLPASLQQHLMDRVSSWFRGSEAEDEQAYFKLTATRLISAVPWEEEDDEQSSLFLLQTKCCL
ncbi:hypothetical protein Efla_005424 [Eimeria flavescens]